MKNQTNVVIHAIDKLVDIAERAFSNLFGDFTVEDTPKPKAKTTKRTKKKRKTKKQLTHTIIVMVLQAITELWNMT